MRGSHTMKTVMRVPSRLPRWTVLTLCLALLAPMAQAQAGDVLTPPKPPRSLPPGGSTEQTIPLSQPVVTLSTDKPAYLPGEMVIISGTGFETGETVELKIRLSDGSYSDTWNVDAAIGGKFDTYWYLPVSSPLGDQMTSEASGLSSGLAAEATFVAGSSVLKWKTLIPDSTCPDGYFPACVCLGQSCGDEFVEPLANRPIIFYLALGDCADPDSAIIADTVYTDAFGNACSWISAPSLAGNYTLRAKYEGEAAPSPCPMPGNNACDPTSGDAAVRCTDINGTSLCHTLNVTNSPNHPPTINFGLNAWYDICVPVELCITYNLTDPDGLGGLYEENLSGFGEFRDQVNGIYFTPDTSGVYVLIAKTTDPCGAFDIDTVVITIDMNDPPSIAFGPDLYYACQPPPGAICLPYTVADPDGFAGAHETLVSGPGTIDPTANKVCFTPAGPGVYTFIARITDTCSLFDQDTIVVTIGGANPPTISFGNDTSITLCQPGPICLPYAVSDPDGLQGLIESQVAGPGAIDTLNNRVCFDATTNGTHTIIARVVDSCGGVDYDTIVVNVTVGGPPTIAFGADFGTGGCTPSQICVPYTVSDPQGLAGLMESLVTGPAGAVIDTLQNRVCFTPPVSGTYTVIAKVTDPCGAEDRDTIRVTVTLNSPPVVTFGPDSTIRQCALGPVCVTYGVSDANGPAGIIETLVSAPAGATFDAANNRVCFTPTGEGLYTVIVKAKDPCNAEDADTIVVRIDVNDPPVVTGPADTTIFLCASDTVCVGPFAATDPNANIATLAASLGWIDGARVCFAPDTAGYYRIIVCATDSCAAQDCDTVVARIVLNAGPVCNIPGDTAIVECFASPLCLPVSATDIDGNLVGCELVSGPGVLAQGQWCYTPAGDESFDVVIRCADACGAVCEDTFTVSFNLNEPPICEFNTPVPPACLPETAFVSFAVTDPEGKLDTCIITSGPGWLSGTTWFYEPGPGETVNVTICCYDECGDSCCISFTLTYPVPQPPVCQIPSLDTTFTICTPTQVCIPISATSANPPVVCSLVAGVGTLSNGQWCYTPSGTEVDTITVHCTDICGESCEQTFIARFNINSPPTITLATDRSEELCTAQNPVCVTYTVSDPNGFAGLVESLVSGPTGAAIDTALNKICFSPTAPGAYTFIARVQDACGAFDLDTAVITITPSTPPNCNLPGNTIVRVCGSQPICLPVSATADDVPVNCVVTSGPGAVANGFWCYTPTAPGVVNVTITCTDACGATCSGSFQVDIRFNGPPTIAFGNDSSLFQCAPTLICLPYTVSDPDVPAKWTESIISAPPGATIDTVANRVCFTPPGAGAHTIIARVTDSCGLFDQDTIVVTVNLNDPPVIAFGRDTSVFQCAAQPICLPYTVNDPDGLAGLVETKLSGPGAIDTAANRVCFTPTGSGVSTIIVKVADPCGLFDQDTINVTVTLNQPPVCNLPRDTTIFQCAPTPVCLPVSATDPDGNFKVCTLTAGPGTLTNGQWCYTPTGDQEVTVSVMCADSCNAACEGSFKVNFVINDPPVCNIPGDTTFTFLCSLATIQLPVGASDPNNNLRSCAITSGPGELLGGFWTFTPTEPGQYCVTIACTDSCNQTCQSSFCVTVNLNTEDCNCIFKLTIGGEEPTDGLNGQAVTVPIVLQFAKEQMGGFDLLLCYDETGIFLTQVAKGPSLAAWEYFTYRLGVFGNCVGGCPSGIIRLIGITDMNNGKPITDPNAWKPVGTIANLTFVLTSDRNFIGQCIPIYWCWFQCGDNAISSRTGDTLFIEETYDFDSCQSNAKADPVPGICFENGRICILEPPDDRGDLNLNGIANEIGDAVLYTNFFIYGNSVWDPIWKDVQILASDINDDGLVLTIADLVYLIRIITGDEQPYPPGGHPKLATASPVAISTDAVGEALSIRWDSELDIGGAHFIVDLPEGATVGEVTLAPEAANMKVRAHRDGNQLRLLVYSDTTEIIPAGSRQIVSIAMTHANEAVLSTHDLATSDGWVMPSLVNTAKAALPTEFTVAQNYPNPFNAGTIIRFGTNVATDYTLAIYDILGRRVWGAAGHSEAGWVEVEWNGRDEHGNSLASGLYLYRVQTASGVQTRKMTLLK
ncbi:MAG TPA: T9SS type A sorting domain-containing protein [bacterium]|nr:T9SS type A sorting domain-containing protein [bacterium]